MSNLAPHLGVSLEHLRQARQIRTEKNRPDRKRLVYVLGNPNETQPIIMTDLEYILRITGLDILQLFTIGGALVAMSGIALFTLVFFTYHVLWKQDSKNWLINLFKNQFPALVLIPIFAGTAVCIVLMFEVTIGDIEFSVPGFDFKGASGPIVLWILCFLALVTAARLLWHRGASDTPEEDGDKRNDK